MTRPPVTALSTDTAPPAARPMPSTFLNVRDQQSRLPLPATEIYETFVQERDELHAAFMAVHNSREEARSDRRVLQNRLNLLTHGRSDGGHGLPADDPRVVAEAAKINAADRKLAMLDRRYDAAQAEWQPLARLVDHIAGWLSSAHGNFSTYDGPQPALRKGETVATAIEARRKRLRELHSDRLKYQSAPRYAAAAKAFVRAEIELHAEAGRPDVTACVDHGEAIRWPVSGVSRTEFGVLKAPVSGGNANTTFDALAVLCWLRKDELIAALESEIDALADDGIAMSDHERSKLLAEVESDLLAVAREEESFIREAVASGLKVERRADADPRAVLGIE